jgi:hypothetical protein
VRLRRCMPVGSQSLPRWSKSREHLPIAGIDLGKNFIDSRKRSLDNLGHLAPQGIELHSQLPYPARFFHSGRGTRTETAAFQSEASPTKGIVKVMPVRAFTPAQCSRSGAKRFPMPGHERRQIPASRHVKPCFALRLLLRHPRDHHRCMMVKKLSEVANSLAG